MKKRSKNSPGKGYRKGISLTELFQMFPNDLAAEKWFEKWRWFYEPVCPRCSSEKVSIRKNRKPMPYHCKSCRRYFSVRTGTPMEASNISLQKWAIGIFLYATSLKGVSSMKLHRDLGIGQSAAWFMLHRLREVFSGCADVFSGTVEVDETYMGGLEGNKRKDKKLNAGRGGAGKSIVAGIKNRETNQVKAKVVENTRQKTLHGFIEDNVEEGSTVNTDDFKSYRNLAYYNHEFVKHSVGEYVDEQIHINGMESFWSMLKRSHKGTYHKMSKKHLNRYVNEFVLRHNIREMDTIDQMEVIVAGMAGRRIMYKDLVSGEDGRMN